MGGPLSSTLGGWAVVLSKVVVSENANQETDDEADQQKIAKNGEADKKDEKGPKDEQQARYRPGYRYTVDSDARMPVHDVHSTLFDDAALYYADKPMVAGKDAIWEIWNATMSRPGFSMSIESVGVQVPSPGNLAFSHGVYRTMTKDTLGRTVTNEGEYAVVYAKQADGQWRIVADNGDSALGAHSLPKFPDKRKRTSLLMDAFAVMALTFSLFFLFVVPILFLLFLLDFPSEGWSTSFLVSVVMLTAFAVTAALLWEYVATHYWNLSFLTALAAAGDAARYGHPVEHTAENVLCNLLVFSTLSAVVTGTITALVRYLWFRRTSLAAR